ncbi:MAG: hypothetical protein ACE5FR_07375 [Rhodospirillales bacterium]
MSGAGILNSTFPSTPPSVPIAQIQKTAVNRATGTSIATTFTTTPVENNLIVGVLVLDKTESAYAIPAGFTEAVSEFGGGGESIIFYKVAGAAESKTVTVTGVGGSKPNVLMTMEYEGIAASSPLDVTASAIAATNTSAHSTGTTATTAQAKALAVAAVAFEKEAGTSTSWSNSFVEEGVGMDAVGGATEVSGGFATKILAATGTQETTWTIGGTASKGSGCVATFKGS